MEADKVEKNDNLVDDKNLEENRAKEITWDDLRADPSSSIRRPIEVPQWEKENLSYVSCPYFPEHKFPKKRLAYHLMKCQHKPDAPNLLACPFNYLHRIKLEHCAQHLKVCEDRQYFADIALESPSYMKTVRALGEENVKDGWEIPEGEEVWE